ncbi:EAL domain-containing protein [Vulcaniibacterium gelatinicum]|uniref:EAL domain-containing protein n=1 Tax=Vulcaniibacterium gelatinicum TaxID=2598725 RepID=UPI0011CC23BC|nr:EAL domain-containing protein [Vulcaniibacterium gelatinicum]
MNHQLRVLILDDNPDDVEAMRRTLMRAGDGFEVAGVATREALLEALDAFVPDAVICDYRLPGFDGRQAIELIRSRRPELPVLVVSGSLPDEAAVELIRVGACDYVLKDRMARLAPAVMRAIEEAREREALQRAQHELMISERNYRRLFEAARDGVLVLDADTLGVLDINPSMCRMIGEDKQELIGAPVTELAAEGMDAEWVDACHRLRHAGHLDGENLTMRSTAGILPIECAGSAYPVNGSRLMQWQMRDVSERRQREIQVRRHATRQALVADFGRRALAGMGLHALFDYALDTVCRGVPAERARLLQVAPDGRALYLRAERGLEGEGLGRRAAEAEAPGTLTRAVMDTLQPVLVDDVTRDFRFADVAALHDRAVASALEVPIAGVGGLHGVLGAYAGDPGAFDAGSVSFMQAVANTVESALERQTAEDRLAYISQFDELTGLPNRTLFRDRVSQALLNASRHHGQAAVLFADLGQFRKINDSLGHAAGDELLRQVARRLQDCVGEGDTVARLGGDEFAIAVAAPVAVPEAIRVARRAILALTSAFEVAGQDVYLGASIGVAVYPDDGAEAERLVKNAETAMYTAKEQGRNTIHFFTPELHAVVSERVALERELRQALERGEFELHYQPQVSLRDGRIVGAEALLRWRHPRRGLLTPDKFIRVAEDSGVIEPIDLWVLEHACEEAAAWAAAGRGDLFVAVNVSPLELRRGQLPRRADAALHRSGLAPARLELELTENLVMDGAEAFIRTMAELKTLGVHISLDDFGTGYSSLSYLKRFPIDRLKVDRSFVAGMLAQAEDAAIVRAVIAMAHQLGLKVVAEGIETAEQAQHLSRQRCDFGQGYLFARPMDAAAFRALLADTPDYAPLWAEDSPRNPAAPSS